MRAKSSKVLIIDNDADILINLKMFLEQHFSAVITETSPNQILNLLRDYEFDAILLDMNFKKGENDGAEGSYWVKKILSYDNDAVIVLMTDYGDIDLAVKSIRDGAFDFILKPWKNAKLLASVLSASSYRRLKREVKKLKQKETNLKEYINENSTRIIGESVELNLVIEAIDKIAETDANILIFGEIGTGKGLVARQIHEKSLRKSEAFIRVDLCAINESLFEREMFGHIKGAFTDANTDKPGRFEIADKGTIFLDEIGNLPYSLQSKLLTVIQEKKIYRVGSNEEINIDVRVICASNMPLYDMVDEDKFRSDLLYRINTFEIKVPPLRDRKRDIPILINHFLKIFSEKYKTKGLRINKRTIQRLQKYHWPGNIRELHNAVERAIIMSDSKVISIENFLISSKEISQSAEPETLNIDEMEKILIQKAIDKNKGNITRAAKDLGIKRNALYRRIEKHGLQ